MGDKLKGKVAIVTGSGQGIGKAVAVALAAEGAKVVTNNRKPGTAGGDAATVAAEIKAAGGEAVPFFGSVSDFKEAQQAVQTAVKNFGGLILSSITPVRMPRKWSGTCLRKNGTCPLTLT